MVPAGLINRMTPFISEIVPVQLLRIGRLYLIGIPGEPTIMSGLRLRRTVASIVGAELADVLCVGYSNAYIHYVTTPEEYLEQRYEGGSTLFGRWELPALMQTVAGLAEAMRDGRPATTGQGPIRKKPLSWVRTPRPTLDRSAPSSPSLRPPTAPAMWSRWSSTARTRGTICAATTPTSKCSAEPARNGCRWPMMATGRRASSGPA